MLVCSWSRFVLMPVLVLVGLTTGLARADAPADQIAAARADAAKDPESALTGLEALRELPAPDGARAAVGALHVLNQLRRHDEAKSLVTELLADSTLPADLRVETISIRLSIMSRTRDWADDATFTNNVDEALLAAAGNDKASLYYQEFGGLRVNQ